MIEKRKNEKRCGSCQKWKPKTDFNKHSKKADGLQPTCKDCRVIENKISYEKNKPKRLEYQNNYRISHKKEVDEYQKKYNKELSRKRKELKKAS